jgi:hypothetical protein
MFRANKRANRIAATWSQRILGGLEVGKALRFREVSARWPQ